MDVKKRIKVALSVIGAILIAVLGLILFWRLSKSTKGKPVASKTQSNMPKTAVDEKVTVARGKTTKVKRPLHSSGRPTESTEEEEEEVNLPNTTNIEPLQRKPEHNPVKTAPPRKTPGSTSQPPPLPLSLPETKTPDHTVLGDGLKKMLEENKEPQLSPTKPSVFRFPPPPKANGFPPSKVKLLDFDEIKDLPTSQLEELRKQCAKDLIYDIPDTSEHRNCSYNTSLLDVLLFHQPDWDATIFQEWKNTNFQIVECPEFIKWLKDAYGQHRSNGIDFLETVLGMHFCKRDIYNTFDAASHVQFYMALLAREYLNTLSGMVTYGPYLALGQFLETGAVDNAKVFFDSLKGKLHEYGLFSKLFIGMQHPPLRSETSFSCNMLYYWTKQQISQPKIMAPDFQVQLKTLKESDTLEHAFQMWTKCVSKYDSDRCTTTLLNVHAQCKIEQELEDLAAEYKNFKEGKHEKLVDGQAKGQLHLLEAFKAYLVMRQYFDSIIFAKLESMVISVFGVSQMPSDRKSLTVETYKKHPGLHNEVAKYLLFSSFKKECISFGNIMDSVAEYKKSKEEAGNKEKVVTALISIIEACLKGTDCTIDMTSKEFSCTTIEGNSMLEVLSKFEGEMATYCQELLAEGMKLNDLAKFIVYLKDEMDLIKSSMSEFLNPSIKI